MSRLSPQINPLTFHSRSQTSLFLLVFSRPIAYLQAGHTGTLLCICLLVALPPNPRSAHSFVLWLRIFLRKDAIFKKPYLRKMPLSFLLLLCSVISLFHWFVQNSLHVRPNGQQFAHFVLCVSILGIILFSLHCQGFIFRLQHLDSRELRQFSLIKSLFSRSMNQNFLFMLNEKFPSIVGLFLCRIRFARSQVTENVLFQFCNFPYLCFLVLHLLEQFPVSKSRRFCLFCQF